MASNDNGSDSDFSFGFNDINFSDRVLRIEIEHDDKNEDDHGIETKTIHISSIILAAKSPFFLKLFTNGMKESEECQLTLKIHSSEEVALMDLLNFMYSNKLSSSTTSSLLDVLVVADKFQVSSCMRYCIQLLCDLPMTSELASQFLQLPSSVLVADGVQNLTDAVKKHLVGLYKDFTKFEEEVFKLPLAGIEVVLSSDDLLVTSEDIVYDFVLKWSRKHYPVIEKRREILTTRLASLIRFKYMTCQKLKDITSCDDFDPAYASKVVIDALFFKAQSPHLQTIPRFLDQPFKKPPVKVLESKSPHPHCIVYFDVKKEEFDNLLPLNDVESEYFHVGGKWFYLYAQRSTKNHMGEPLDSFGLFLGMAKYQGPCFVAFEFSARSKPTEEFSRYNPKVTYTFNEEQTDGFGYLDFFQVHWSQFIDKDSIYFINGVLYLKIEITMKP